MKRTVFMVILVLCTFTALGQNFSGKITKKVRYIPKTAGLDLDSLKESEYGQTSTYLIKDGFYRSSYHKNGLSTYSYTYQKGKQKMYDEDYGAEYITWRDASKPSDNIRPQEIYRDSVQTIFGYECFLVKTVYDGYTNYSYFAKDLRVNYQNFKGHNVANWYNRLKQLDGAQLLKTVNDYPTHQEIWEAIDLDMREVADSEFDLPADKPVFASYQALDEQVSLVQPSQKSFDCYQKKVQKGSQKLANGEAEVVLIRMVVLKDGSLDYITPVETSSEGLHLDAMAIFEGCGLEFTAGQLFGKPISSEIVFPVEFKN